MIAIATLGDLWRDRIRCSGHRKAGRGAWFEAPDVGADHAVFCHLSSREGAGAWERWVGGWVGGWVQRPRGHV